MATRGDVRGPWRRPRGRALQGFGKEAAWYVGVVKGVKKENGMVWLKW